jgi:hypothetical protein
VLLLPLSSDARQVTFNVTDFTIAGAAHMAITGTATTTLWFDVGFGLRVYSCENVTVSSATIDYWVLPYVQATVVSVSESRGGRSGGGGGGGMTTYKLQLAPRSAAPEIIIPLLNLANPGHFWKVRPPNPPDPPPPPPSQQLVQRPARAVAPHFVF